LPAALEFLNLPAIRCPHAFCLPMNHALIRQGLKALLEKQGFQIVAEASDGQEALRSVQKTQPDVAIIDISMPVLNGVDAAAN